MLMAITYGDEKFEDSVHFNLFTAKYIGGAQKLKAYGPTDLDSEFKSKYENIVSQKKGAGYWIWKPYIILQALEKLEENDYLMYSDAGTFYVKSINNLIKQLERDKNDILLSSSILPVKHWCKRDAFELIDCNFNDVDDLHMIEGGYLLLRKSANSVAFIKKWLEYMTDIRIVSDLPNTCGQPNDLSFRENRHDQTVLTLLAIKEGIKPYKGLSDSSELRRYIFYKDFEFWDYTIKDLAKFGLQERSSWGYIQSKYPRIIVNTRIRGKKGKIRFYLRILHSALDALKVDTIGRIKEKKYLNVG